MNATHNRHNPLQGALVPQLASIGEVTDSDIVLEVKPAGHALKYPFAAAGDNRVLTPADDLACGGGTIRVLGLEFVPCPERVIRIGRADEVLVAFLHIRPTWRAFGACDKDVMAAHQVPGHFDDIGGAQACNLRAFTRTGVKTDARDLHSPRGPYRAGVQQSKAEKRQHCHATDHRKYQSSSVHFFLLSSITTQGW